MLTQETIKYIEDHAQEAYELLTELARIPAPSNHEEKRAAFCQKWLQDMGAEGVYTDNALNVVYPYHIEKHKPIVVFMAHTDVVFPDTDDLPLYEKDGMIFCPGIGDDTANLVALMMAAKYVTENKIIPVDCGILFVCNSGEEGLGNLKGVRKICADYGAEIRELYSFDHDLTGVVNGAVGSARYKVNVKTPGGHSYKKFGSENAIANLSEIIRKIYALELPAGGTTTYNVGTIEGGTSVNTIAQEASMLCEYRSDCEESLDYMKRKFHEIFEAQRSENVSVSVELIGLRPCEHLNEEQRSRKDQLVSDTVSMLEAITGKPVETVSGSTDCNIPLSLGIPAICCGCFNGGGAHTREEYLEKDSLMMGYRVAFETVLRYC